MLESFPHLEIRSGQAVHESVLSTLAVEDPDLVALSSAVLSVTGYIIACAPEIGLGYVTSGDIEDDALHGKLLEILNNPTNQYPIEAGISTYSMVRFRVPQGQAIAIGFWEGLHAECVQCWDIFVYPA